MLCAIAPRAFLHTAGPGQCPPPPWMHEEDQLLVLLVATWVLVSGRTPPLRPVDRLSAEELIEFWADEHTAADPPTSAEQPGPDPEEDPC